MISPNKEILTFTLHRHLDFLDLLCSTSVRDITLTGQALVPFIELFEFTGSYDVSCNNANFANIFFERLSSYVSRAELLHRMNEYLSFRFDQSSDWFVTCHERNKGHYTFYRGSSTLLFEFVKSPDDFIIFNLYR